MAKSRRAYETSRTKFRLQLILFAAFLIFFIFIFTAHRSSDDPSADQNARLKAMFDASSLDLETPDGLPRPPGAGGEAEDAPTIDDISESTVTANDLKLMLSRLPIADITIKADESSENAPSVTIKNETKYKPDLAALLKAGPSLSLSGDGPQVLIYHTHTSEAYTPTGENSYTPDDNDRTLDKRYNVVRVGQEIERVLKEKGIGVVHYTDGYFDYPSYTGSYNRSLEAVNQMLKKYPSVKVVIDVHRDAMITSAGVKYKTVTTINGKEAAQLMLVCGTDAGGLPHKDWSKNLAFNATLQQTLLSKYPSLMRPINLRAARFNQHVSTCATLLEVGTCGNTLEEAIYAASLFADTLGDTLKKYQK